MTRVHIPRGGKLIEDRCHAAVHDDGMGVGFHQCTRHGKIESEGVLWCKQHSPEETAKRDAERERKYQEYRAAQSLKYSRIDAHREVVSVAIKYFRQQASHDDLESAVIAYERLVL